MIARQANRIARFRLTCMASAVACLLPALAAAENIPGEEPPPTERMPWEQAPEGPSLWDDPTIDGSSTSLPDLEEETAAAPAPVDTGPEIPAPKVDAYFDVGFNDTDVGAYGYPSSSSGYRFIFGLILQDAGTARFSVAPEVGYFRMNTAERDEVTFYENYPGGALNGYDVTETKSYSTDVSSLDFGGRFGYQLHERLSAFARAGFGFYHTNHQQQTTLSFSPDNASFPPREDDTQLQSSVSDAGLAPYLSVGAAVSLGQVPQIYFEYGTRYIAGDALQTGSLGFFLNF